MENNLFPGRPDYTGPKIGWFAFLHHDCFIEHSNNVMERVLYVKNNKPENERAIRLHNMMYIGDCPLLAEYEVLRQSYFERRKKQYLEYVDKQSVLYKDKEHNQRIKLIYDQYSLSVDNLDVKVLAYIRQHIPDCAWDGNELVFPPPPLAASA